MQKSQASELEVRSMPSDFLPDVTAEYQPGGKTPGDDKVIKEQSDEYKALRENLEGAENPKWSHAIPNVETWNGDSLWNPEQIVADCSFFADGAFSEGFFPSGKHAKVRGININLRHKKALEDFANLELGKANFGKNKTVDFVKLFQLRYRDLDPPLFPKGFFSQLAINPHGTKVPFWIAYRNLLRAAWYSRFADAYIPRLLGVPVAVPDERTGTPIALPGQRQLDYTSDPIAQNLPPPHIRRTGEYVAGYPLHSVILALVRSDWKAKICEGCRRFFIAEKPGNRFHTKQCFANSRTGYKAQAERERRKKLKDEINSKSRLRYKDKKGGKVRSYNKRSKARGRVTKQ